MKKYINIISIFVSSAMVLFAFIVDLTEYYRFYTSGKLLFYGLPIIILFCNMIYQIKTTSDPNEKDKFRKQGLYGMFIIYLVAIFTLLFLAGTFRVHYSNGMDPFSKVHFENAANLVPFESVKLYFDHISSMPGSFMINIVGNLVIFAPMGFFVTLLFNDKIKNVAVMTLFMILLVSIVEFLQFVFFVGSADIDDVILNTIGAVVIYLIMKIPFVKNAVNKLLE